MGLVTSNLAQMDRAEVCRQLTIEEKVLNSKMLPFRFASAYKEVENIGTDDSENDIVFESDKKRAK